MAKVLCCLAFGTRGDVEPVLRVALRSYSSYGVRNGPRVTFVTHETHKSWLAPAEGVDFVWVSTPPVLPRSADAARLWSADQGEACLAAARGADGLAFNLFALEGVHLADLLKLPCVVVQGYALPGSPPSGWREALEARQPALFRRLTRNFRRERPDWHALDPEDRARSAPPATIVLDDVEHWLWPALLDDRWLAYRATIEGGEPKRAHGLARFLRRRGAPEVIYGVDESLFPRPGYWLRRFHVLGSFLRDEDGDGLISVDTAYAPAAGAATTRAAEDFLAGAADPGVFLSLGAAGTTAAGCLTREAAEAIYGGLRDALRATGRLGVVQADEFGYAMAAFRETANVFVIDGPVDHGPIMRRCACVVHHGGAGTTHAAAERGCAQVVVPFFFDQFFWAENVAYRGVGLRAEPAGVGAAIEAALGGAMRFRAVTLARRLFAYGVNGASVHVESALRPIDGSTWPDYSSTSEDSESDGEDDFAADVEFDCGVVVRLPRASPSENAHLERELFVEGCYDEAFAGLSPDENQLVVDVGAHCGLLAVRYAPRYPRAYFVCVEPRAYDKPARKALGVNLRRYCGSRHFRICPYAAGAEDGEGSLTTYPAMPGNSTLRPREKRDEHFRGLAADDLFAGAAEQPVKVQKLDTLCFSAQFGGLLCEVNTLDLLKIDVEGHEYDVLLGARSTLACAERVVVEVHDVDGRLGACVKLLEASGFRTHTRSAPACLPTNHLLFGRRPPRSNKYPYERVPFGR